MGYYTFDLLPLTTIHVTEFWLAKIIWAGQAFLSFFFSDMALRP